MGFLPERRETGVLRLSGSYQSLSSRGKNLQIQSKLFSQSSEEAKLFFFLLLFLISSSCIHASGLTVRATLRYKEQASPKYCLIRNCEAEVANQERSFSFVAQEAACWLTQAILRHGIMRLLFLRHLFFLTKQIKQTLCIHDIRVSLHSSQITFLRS